MSACDLAEEMRGSIRLQSVVNVQNVGGSRTRPRREHTSLGRWRHKTRSSRAPCGNRISVLHVRPQARPPDGPPGRRPQAAFLPDRARRGPRGRRRMTPLAMPGEGDRAESRAHGRRREAAGRLKCMSQKSSERRDERASEEGCLFARHATSRTSCARRPRAR